MNDRKEAQIGKTPSPQSPSPRVSESLRRHPNRFGGELRLNLVSTESGLEPKRQNGCLHVLIAPFTDSLTRFNQNPSSLSPFSPRLYPIVKP